MQQLRLIPLLFWLPFSANSVVLQPEQLTEWLQSKATQQTIATNQAQWRHLTPEQLTTNATSQQLLALEWVVHKQLIRLRSHRDVEPATLQWVSLWRSYTSQIQGEDKQPLFHIAETAAALLAQWHQVQTVQSLIARLESGESLYQLSQQDTASAALLETHWQDLPSSATQAFRQALSSEHPAQPISAQQIPLVMQLLQAQPQPELAQKLVASMDALQLNLYSQRLRSLMPDSYAALLHYAASQPQLANTALALLAADAFALPATQTLLFSSLNSVNSGGISAALLARYGGEAEWQQLYQLITAHSAQPSLAQQNALLALRFSSSPQAAATLQKIPKQRRQQLQNQSAIPNHN